MPSRRRPEELVGIPLGKRALAGPLRLAGPRREVGRLLQARRRLPVRLRLARPAREVGPTRPTSGAPCPVVRAAGTRGRSQDFVRARTRSFGDDSPADTPAENSCAGGNRLGDGVGTTCGRYGKVESAPRPPSFREEHGRSERVRSCDQSVPDFTKGSDSMNRGGVNSDERRSVPKPPDQEAE